MTEAKPFKVVLIFDVISEELGKTHTVVLDCSGVVGQYARTTTGDDSFILPTLNVGEYYNLSDVIVTGYDATCPVKSLKFIIDDSPTKDVICVEANLPSAVQRQFQNKIFAFEQNRKIKLEQAR